MSEQLKLVVQGLLRPSEVVHCVVEASVVPQSDSREYSRQSSQSRGRIVSVITYLDPQPGKESQGCVLVIKAPPGKQAARSEYSFEHAFPISSGLSISMAQSPRTNLDRMSYAVNSPGTGFTMSISYVDNPSGQPLTLWTSDSEGLRALLEEYRRCKAVSELQGEGQDFSWLAAYAGRSSRPAILSAVPPDLRMLHKPVHTLLSPASAGLPGDEALDVAIIREDWIRRRIRTHLLLGAERRSSLRVRVGTFNVNGKLPTQDLSPWLRDDSHDERFIPPLKEISPLSLTDFEQSPLGTDAASAAEASDKDLIAETHGDPDLFVLGFQEVDLSAEALLYSTKTVREDAWCAAIFAGLGEKAVLYEKLVTKQLVGMLLIVVVRKRLSSCFRDIRTASVGAGIMGMMGNKGATAVRLTYAPPSTEEGASRPCTLTFVNSHLAAFDEMFDRRNADFHDISKRLLFDSGVSVLDTVSQGDASWANPALSLNVFESDALFWTGDLNYRLNLPDADVRHLLSSPRELRRPNMKVMLKFDQLLLARHLRKAFEGFQEHTISHAPSYRFSTGTMADPLGYDTKRKPAWTDRILHMHSAMVDVRQSSYTSHPGISMSDHKPVSASFNIQVAEINNVKFEAFVQDLWREVGLVEGSEEVPRLKIDTTFIDMGAFSIRKPIRRDLRLQNVGKIPCTYRFVAAQPGADVFPEWLEVDQITGLLLPGEAAVLRICTRTDTSLASKLNLSENNLQGTLILHTALGKDHFITISALYERTCFATSLQTLARLPGPMRRLEALSDLLPTDHAATAPREIMRIINWIMTNATDVGELFLKNGNPDLVDTVCECLDTGVEFPFHGSNRQPEVALAVGDAFIRLLHLLPEPIIPTSLVTRCTEVTSKDDAFLLLEELPAVNLNVWISTTALLHYLAQQCAEDIGIEQLVVVFTPVLLPDDVTALTSPPVSVVGKRAFLRHFVD